MFDFLEKLRAKPEKIKKQISFLVAFAFAGLVFVVWLSVVYPKFSQKETSSKKEAVSQGSPLSSLTETFSSGFSALSEQFSQLKNAVSSFSSPTADVPATSTVSTTTENNIAKDSTDSGM